MNDHHVYDWIDEASIPKGTKTETSRWCDDIKPRDGDETNVRSRIVVQQYIVVKRDEVYQGTRGKDKPWVLNRALCGSRMASRCFGKLVAEVLANAQFETVSIVPNTYHHPQRDIDTLLRKTGIWITSSKFSRIPWRSSESGGSDAVSQAQEKCSSVSFIGAATDSLGRRIQG